jgi:hypothetical protein
MVIHTCNPSYSGGRDQEDRGSKPTQENSSQDPLSKKTLHKIRLVAWIKVKAVSSRPVPHQKKKKKLDVLAHTYHFSYTGNINRRTVVQASLGIEETLYLKNNESKKG